jgi:hypothetical protein
VKIATPDPALLLGYHAKHKSDGKHVKSDHPMPEILPKEDLPNTSDRVGPKHLNYLENGFTNTLDRSHDLQVTTKNLYSAGLSDSEVLSVLWHSPASRQVALEHRHGSDSKAQRYLWDRGGSVFLDTNLSKISGSLLSV